MESTTIKSLFGRRNIWFIIHECQRTYAWKLLQNYTNVYVLYEENEK